MSREDIAPTISEVFCNLFSLGPEAVHDKLSQDDVDNWDSLQHLNLVMALEEEFGIEISPEESTEMLNFGLCVLLVEDKLKEKG